MKLLLFCLSIFAAYDCYAAKTNSKLTNISLSRIEDFVDIAWKEGEMPYQFAIEARSVHEVVACFIADRDLNNRVCAEFARQLVHRVAQGKNVDASLFESELKDMGADTLRCALLLKMSATDFDWFAHPTAIKSPRSCRENYRPRRLIALEGPAAVMEVPFIDGRLHSVADIGIVIHINHDRIEEYFQERFKECFVL